jgi:hypothetical protein
MKTEEFFRIVLGQVFDVDKQQIGKHFKEFKRNFAKLPITIESLQNDVKDQNGNVLSDDQINQYIEELRINAQEYGAEFLKPLFFCMHAWLDLFRNEIKLQLDFAKESFNDYQKLKRNNPIDSKQIFKAIHHFSIHAANICKLLDKTKSKVDNPAAQLLSPLSGKLDFDLKALRQLRNHLEHFEERLDAWHYLNWGKPILDMNIFNKSTKGIRVGECLRVLDIENDEFYILGEKFELKLLFQLITRIEKTFRE